MNASALAILLEAKRIGGSIWIENGKLGYRLPSGPMTETILNGLKKHKEEIKQFIIEREQTKTAALDYIVSHLDKVRKNPRGYSASCPAPDHGLGRGDRTPSLSIWIDSDGRLVLNCFAGCSRGEILDGLGLTEEDIQQILRGKIPQDRRFKPKKVLHAGRKPEQFLDRSEIAKAYQEQLIADSIATKYLESRGIPFNIAKQYGIGYAPPDEWGGESLPWPWGRVTFPHKTPDGKIVNLYGRAVGETDKISDPKLKEFFQRVKHLHLPGPKGIFNVDALNEDVTIVTEGAFDALSLIVSGYPNACAVFGLFGIHWDWMKAKDIIFALDNDGPGNEAWEKLSREALLHGKRASRIKENVYQGYKDLNEVLINKGKIDLDIQETRPILVKKETEEPAQTDKSSIDMSEQTDPFVQLHLHSQMSTLDGIASTKEIVDRAKELNQSAVALTNHGNMVDHVEFIEQCEAEGIKPIVGNEVYFVPDRFYKEKKGEKRKAYHLILLAMNDTGLKNLYQLTSEAYETGFHYKPRIDWELLERYHEGLICTSACLGGFPQQLLIGGDIEGAKQAIIRFKSIFGDRYYLEIQPNDLRDQKVVNQQFIKWSQEFDIPLVATMDSHHLSPKTYELHKLFTQIGTGDDFIHDYKDNYWTTSGEVINKLVTQTGVPKDIAEKAVKNTELVAERIDQYTIDKSVKLPHYPVPDEFQSEAEYLNHLCDIGWNKRGIRRFSKDKQQQYRERLETELNVILNKGFEGYFLIVWDMIQWARGQGIPVGYGRGSAGGSLVSWLLGIVELDPIKYGLLFERFLNPERKSLPDIDVDFSHDRRGEVIEYLKSKYGQENVMPILTLGTMGASMALRDVGRVLKIPLPEVNKVAKALENLKQDVDERELEHSILDELENIPEVRDIVAKYPKWIKIAKQLEGRVRHFGRHASAVLIADRPVREVLPLMRVNGELVAGGDMFVCEKVGLVKFDILGLKTLDVIDNTVKLIKDTYGVEVDVLDLPEKDEKTYHMLGEAQSAGVFQMDKDGARRLLVDIKPKAFEDLVDINALNRPAPLRTKGEDGLTMAQRYVKICRGELKAAYLHPDLEKILGQTNGQLIYQEQMMIISGVFAGFTLAERSHLQKVISKKKEEEMQEYEKKFIAGCLNNGYRERVAKELWNWIKEGASYLFNKSHSASYSLISYHTAYLKAHYPNEYAASLLSVYRDNEKFHDMISEIRKKGISIAPPLINKAGKGFKTDGGQKIIWGLEAVKGVGKAYQQIVENRPYSSFEDFLKKNTFKRSKVNKRVIVALLKAGAFDDLGDRIELMKKYQSSRPKREEPLVTKDQIEKPELTKYHWEQEVIGFVLTAHPLSEKFTDQQTGGEIMKVKRIKTRKGDPMAFVTVSSPEGIQDLTVFPRQYRQSKAFLKEKKWVIVDIKSTPRGPVANKIREIVL